MQRTLTRSEVIKLISSIPSLRHCNEKVVKKEPGYSRNPGSYSETRDAFYFYLRDKQFGVEPGFEAVKINEQFIQCLEKNKENAKLKTLMTSFLPKFIFYTIEERLQAIKKLIISDREFRKKLIEFLLTENTKLSEDPFIIWMFKKDYDDPDEADRVCISLERYKHLGCMNESPRKKTTRIEENLNSIYECIANDISTLYGIPTQVQELKQSEYGNGKLKFLAASQLARGYQDIGKYYQLRGDCYQPQEKKGLFENYLFEKNAKPFAKSIHVSGIGTLLALMLLLEERDFVGAYGQNLGIVDQGIFKIDLGQACRAKFGILHTLQDNGQFAQPFVNLPIDPIRRHLLYRNSSIMYDAPFSEIMMGFHFLNKLINGVEPSEAIISSYGELFRKTIKNIPRNGLTALFSGYLSYLQMLKQRVKPEEKAEIDVYIRGVHQLQNLIMQNGKQILTVFSERLLLTRQEIDLLSSLEKLTSTVYDLAANQQDRIQYLQVLRNERRPWELRKDQYGIWLRCDLTKNKTLNSYWLRNLNPMQWDISPYPALTQLFLFLQEKFNYKLKFSDGNPGNDDIEIGITPQTLNDLIEMVTEESVHQYRIPLSSTAITLKLAKSAFWQQGEESSESPFSFWQKTSKNNLFESYKKRFLTVTEGSNGKIEKLNLLLDLLAESDLDFFVKKLLVLFKCDDVKKAQERINMLIHDELAELHSEFSASKKTSSANDDARCESKNASTG